MTETLTKWATLNQYFRLFLSRKRGSTKKGNLDLFTANPDRLDVLDRSIKEAKLFIDAK